MMATPDDTNLRIRSVTTLLNVLGHHIRPVATPEGTGRSSGDRQLDSLALLFVTKYPEDVAAVTTKITQNTAQILTFATLELLAKSTSTPPVRLLVR